MFEDVLTKRVIEDCDNCIAVKSADNVENNCNLCTELKEPKMEYKGESLGTPEEISLDLAIKDGEIEFYKEQIDKLADFLINNYGEYICGSAVETAISVLQKEKYKNERM